MKRIVLNRLRPKFVELINNYMQRNNLTQGRVAEMVEIHQPHLAALLSGKEIGRPLSAYYIHKFIRRGIFKVADIYDNQPVDQKEVDFWAMATETENFALLLKIANMKRDGHDVNAVLDEYIEKVNGKK